MNRIKELKQVNWRELKPLQPKDAKIVTNHNAIENSLKRYGFAKPFYGWEFEGEVYTLDGHQRKEVLSNMPNVPETLPCVLIDAKDRKEAIEMLIEVHNQTQNPFDIEVLEEMIEVEVLEVEIKDINIMEYNGDFEEESSKEPPKTDLKEKRQIYTMPTFEYISLFKKSKEGVELKKIKEPEYFERIAYLFYLHIEKIIKNKNTCLVCPPPRRHKDWNLAQKLTEYVGEKIGCNYDIDLFEALSLRKYDANIILKKPLKYDNYVILDDIITTGQTIAKCVELLEGKNILTFVAVHNH